VDDERAGGEVEGGLACLIACGSDD
jgi:hypothetical protein